MSCTTGGWARASVFVALVFAGRLNAAASQPGAVDTSPANNAMTAYGSEGQYLELAKRVTRAQADQYSLILAEYEQYLAAHPQDVAARIERCRFILEFADSDDFPVDTAADDSDRCREGLRAASFERVASLRRVASLKRGASQPLGSSALCWLTASPSPLFRALNTMVDTMVSAPSNNSAR
jgi:hypothetical protein